jgi:hypothetical protein
LDQWRIGDKDLANIIRQLVFAQPPASGRQRQQTLATDETIDYATLEVRQLGDIYEGLLGAHFVKDPKNPGQLELRNQNGQNHRQGIFYTPDWVVLFLVRQTLRPLLDEIENSEKVREAMAGESDEAKKNDSFAKAVLALDLCDPAMGSGHFLVRATEFLAEQIFNHPTTRLKTEKVVPGVRSPSDIRKSRLIPVHPGLKQDDAEIAYWRRRKLHLRSGPQPDGRRARQTLALAHLHRHRRAAQFPGSPSHAGQHPALRRTGNAGSRPEQPGRR